MDAMVIACDLILFETSICKRALHFDGRRRAQAFCRQGEAELVLCEHASIIGKWEETQPTRRRQAVEQLRSKGSGMRCKG